MKEPTKLELLEALKFADTMLGDKEIDPKSPMGVAETIFYCIAKEIFEKSDEKRKGEAADQNVKPKAKLDLIQKITLTNGETIRNAVPALDAPELPGFIGLETLIDVGPEDRPNVDLCAAVRYINADAIVDMLIWDDGED